MTGTFKLKLPPELLTALQQTPVQGPGKDMEVNAMRPSLMERVVEWFSGAPRRRN